MPRLRPLPGERKVTHLIWVSLTLMSVGLIFLSSLAIAAI